VFIGNDAGANESNSGQLIIETAFENSPDNSYPLIKGDFDANYLQVNGILHVSELAKLEPLNVAPVCSQVENFGGIYFNGISEKLMLCVSTGWMPLN